MDYPLTLRDKLILSIIVLLFFSSWHYQYIHNTKIKNAIPEEAIRLRILANSNKVEDQLLKIAIRDAVVKNMRGWIGQVQSLDEARMQLSKHLAEISLLVQSIMNEQGFSYNFDVALTQVPFPVKRYGNLEYPAGMYESLRITIGEGSGDNWWCVLFPPLCFVDMVTGKKVNVVSASNEKSEKKQSRFIVEKSHKPKKTYVFRFLIWEKVKKWLFC